MAGYESDSSGAEDVQTAVLLGYASKEPTSDEFSQLGGHPAWLDNDCTPAATLAKCKVCNGYLSLLLQLNADLPDRYPGHERRIYAWACRRKPCRRKDGSVRTFRGIRGRAVDRETSSSSAKQIAPMEQPQMAATTNIGETLFGVKSPSTSSTNPFATEASGNTISTNPFAAASSILEPRANSIPIETLPQTFAQKASISAQTPSEPVAPRTTEPWPAHSAFTAPFRSYHIDADSEFLESEPMEIPSNARVGGGTLEGEGGDTNEKTLFESSMDKTFQRFADRLAQNPEQVLRYEFGGHPLLYSKTDAVGKLLATEQENSNTKVKVSSSSSSATPTNIPRCTNCGASRVFELQLTPHAILELEAEDMSIDGMDWGTIIIGVCSADCQQGDVPDGAVGYLEEWVGVQWEELAVKRQQ